MWTPPFKLALLFISLAENVPNVYAPVETRANKPCQTPTAVLPLSVNIGEASTVVGVAS